MLTAALPLGHLHPTAAPVRSGWQEDDSFLCARAEQGITASSTPQASACGGSPPPSPPSSPSSPPHSPPSSPPHLLKLPLHPPLHPPQTPSPSSSPPRHPPFPPPDSTAPGRDALSDDGGRQVQDRDLLLRCAVCDTMTGKPSGVRVTSHPTLRVLHLCFFFFLQHHSSCLHNDGECCTCRTKGHVGVSLIVLFSRGGRLNCESGGKASWEGATLQTLALLCPTSRCVCAGSEPARVCSRMDGSALRSDTRNNKTRGDAVWLSNFAITPDCVLWCVGVAVREGVEGGAESHPCP